MGKIKLPKTDREKFREFKLNEEFKTRLIVSGVVLLTLFLIFIICKGTTLNFAVVSDVHIEDSAEAGYSDIQSSKKLFSDAINQINNLRGVKFTLITGDLVNHATEKNFEDFFKLANTLKKPYYITFGNHDYYGPDKKEVINLTKKLNPHYFTNKTYYSFCPKNGFNIISLDSELKNKDTAQGELNINQVYFLEEELKKSKNKTVIIIMHHPIYAPYEQEGHELNNAEEVKKVLAKYKNPIIILAGHYHCAKIETHDNIVQIVNPSLVSYPMGFRQIKITKHKNKTKINVKYFETSLQKNKAENKLNHKNPEILEGTSKDRTNTIIIKNKRK